MKIFQPETATKTRTNRKLYAAYELAHTLVDFAAAVLFTIGSVLFFSESTQYSATWCFVIGSICFAMKPTIKITRELHYLLIGDFDDLAGHKR
ncbi:YrhK family protein [Agrobacterium sp. ES01]|uniref:YrhK family protein n=1 Tax=Agrobacterium sp. ES01 TaxID=3420714 RepID=UPI003D139F5F